jgi:hypothetical protein
MTTLCAKGHAVCRYVGCRSAECRGAIRLLPGCEDDATDHLDRENWVLSEWKTGSLGPMLLILLRP